MQNLIQTKEYNFLCLKFKKTMCVKQKLSIWNVYVFGYDLGIRFILK